MPADETRVRRPAPAPARTGPDAAFLVLIEGGEGPLGRRFPLEASETTLGRDPACAIPLPSAEVSRRHARVLATAEAHLVEDLGSTNGTHLNGREVERAPLASGDRLQVGPYLFKYLSGADAEARYLLDLERLATRDALTGLANRRELLASLERELGACQRHRRPLSLLLLDVDHFKRVNDAWGHPAGDAVLRALAGRLSAAVRAEDCLGRIGGEELALVLPDAPIEHARAVAEKLRRAAAEEAVRFEGREIAVTVSIGVAAAEAADRPEDVLARADARLYASKHAGRNRVSG